MELCTPARIVSARIIVIIPSLATCPLFFSPMYLLFRQEVWRHSASPEIFDSAYFVIPPTRAAAAIIVIRSITTVRSDDPAARFTEHPVRVLGP